MALVAGTSIGAVATLGGDAFANPCSKGDQQVTQGLNKVPGANLRFCNGGVTGSVNPAGGVSLVDSKIPDVAVALVPPGVQHKTSTVFGRVDRTITIPPTTP